jgi:hemolysin activation/secretion protein
MIQKSRSGRNLIALFSVATFSLFLGTSSTFAQVPNQQTTIADPSRVQEQIQRRDLGAQAVPQIDVREGPLAQSAPAGAENIRFTLNDIRLDGVSAYAESDLRAIYGASLGQNITLADLYAIANDLTRKFRNDGYVLTQIVVPPQTIEGGVARLQVVEGYIDRVSVAVEPGAPAEALNSLRQIESMAARISTGRAMNIKDLERYMLLINDLPGVRARGILAPSPTQAGAADLSILLQRDPFEGIVGIDNYGTKFLGPVQLSGTAAFNNPFGYNERLSAQIALAPEPGDGFELGYVALGYAKALGSDGLRLTLDASHTDTAPGYTLKEFDVKGISRFFGIGLHYPLIRTRATSLHTDIGFDIRNVDTRNNIEDTRKDRIRTLRAGGRLEHLDTVFGAGLNIASFQISHGLDVLGASSKNNPDKSRADASGEFTKATIELQRLQRLTSQLNLLLAGRGQLSDGPLLSSEEFGVGGMGFGRGYDPSEIIGDEGYAAKVELQWNIPGQLGYITQRQVFGFFDGGVVWNDDPATADLKRESATSAGLGIRTRIMDATNVDATIAWPISRRVQTMKDDDPRAFFSVSHRF